MASPINIKRPGLLHKKLGVKPGSKIPIEKLSIKPGDPIALKREKQFALNAQHFNHNKKGV